MSGPRGAAVALPCARRRVKSSSPNSMSHPSHPSHSRRRPLRWNFEARVHAWRGPFLLVSAPAETPTEGDHAYAGSRRC